MIKETLQKHNKALFSGDNLDMLKRMVEEGCSNIIDLIYIDPPFNSKRNYNVVFEEAISDKPEEAFKDTWSNVKYLDELEEINTINPRLYNFLKMLEQSIPGSYISYLTSMAIRCYYMRILLKENGSFYFHCDPTMSHYVKIVLDYIYGGDNFRNEIVWNYGACATVNHSSFQAKHDIILYYSKDTKQCKYNELYTPYKESTMKQWNLVDEDGRRYKVITRKRSDGTKYESNYYMGEGSPMTDVWDIYILAPISSERLGYPTQKPESLLERIIKASSNEGDIVADFFMGGGTTIAVSEKLNRKWIGCDLNYRAIQITIDRLKTINPNLKLKSDYAVFGIPKSSVELRQMTDDNIIGDYKNSKFALEDVIVKYYLKNVVGNAKKVGDNSIDGYFGFKFENKNYKGLVQVTAGSNINHFKSFVGEISNGTGDLGVYVTYKDCITDGMIKIAKKSGKLSGVDKVQILTIEDLVDKGIQYEVPREVLTFE